METTMKILSIINNVLIAVVEFFRWKKESDNKSDKQKKENDNGSEK